MFDILNDPDSYEPGCVCCPVRDICDGGRTGEAMIITKEIRNRSNCDGDEFDTWEYVSLEEIGEKNHD